MNAFSFGGHAECCAATPTRSLSSAENDLVKILTGVRGCGKTTLLRQIAAELQAAGKRTLFINCDDRATAHRFRTGDDLIAEVESALAGDKLYERYSHLFDQHREAPAPSGLP